MDTPGTGHWPEVRRVLTGFAWAAGSALASMGVLDVIAAIGIGAGMAVVVGLDLGPTPGIAVYLMALVSVALAFAAFVHFGLALAETVTPVPSIVWPAMALFPMALVVADLFDREDVYEPMLGILALIGLGIAWFTTKRRRRAPARVGDRSAEAA